MERLRQWKRLKQVRELQERVREAEYALATDRLRAADEVLRAMLAAASAAAHARRLAMKEGDGAGCTVGESMGGGADRQRRQWLPERSLRAADRDAKQIALMRARLERERCEQRLADMRAQVAVEEARRTQAASDDRFAARRHWLRLMSDS